MKVYVICDLEKYAGVVDFRQQCCFDGAQYHQARRLATRAQCACGGPRGEGPQRSWPGTDMGGSPAAWT